MTRVFTYPYWRISFGYTDPSTGGATRSFVVLQAPTATDALTMFELNTRSNPPVSRYFRGAEHIEVCTHLCARCEHPKDAHHDHDGTETRCTMPDCNNCAGFVY